MGSISRQSPPTPLISGLTGFTPRTGRSRSLRRFLTAGTARAVAPQLMTFCRAGGVVVARQTQSRAVGFTPATIICGRCPISVLMCFATAISSPAQLLAQWAQRCPSQLSVRSCPLNDGLCLARAAIRWVCGGISGSRTSAGGHSTLRPISKPTVLMPPAPIQSMESGELTRSTPRTRAPSSQIRLGPAAGGDGVDVVPARKLDLVRARR